MFNGPIIAGKKCSYQVLRQLGETDSYRLYEVSADGVEKKLVLKIAVNASHNGALDRESFLLSRMREHALLLEQEFANLYPGKHLNYQYGFPYVYESFVATEQGCRRVLILEIEAVDELETLVPLSMIRTRDRVRVDHKTAAWIMGKSLKILAFAHDFGVSCGEITSDDIVVERDSHMVMFFDWLKAVRISGGGSLSKESVHQEMYRIAQAVVQVMGGDILTFAVPGSADDHDKQFQDFVYKLSRGGFATTSAAHEEFYRMVEGMWGRKFHPYTAFPL